MFEVSMNLPVNVLVQQIEMKFTNEAKRYGLLSKYLRIAGVTKRSVIRKEELERDSRAGDDIQLTINRLPPH